MAEQRRRISLEKLIESIDLLKVAQWIFNHDQTDDPEDALYQEYSGWGEHMLLPTLFVIPTLIHLEKHQSRDSEVFKVLDLAYPGYDFEKQIFHAVSNVQEEYSREQHTFNINSLSMNFLFFNSGYQIFPEFNALATKALLEFDQWKMHRDKKFSEDPLLSFLQDSPLGARMGFDLIHLSRKSGLIWRSNPNALDQRIYPTLIGLSAVLDLFNFFQENPFYVDKKIPRWHEEQYLSHFLPKISSILARGFDFCYKLLEQGTIKFELDRPIIESAYALTNPNLTTSIKNTILAIEFVSNMYDLLTSSSEDNPDSDILKKRIHTSKLRLKQLLGERTRKLYSYARDILEKKECQTIDFLTEMDLGCVLDKSGSSKHVSYSITSRKDILLAKFFMGKENYHHISDELLSFIRKDFEQRKTIEVQRHSNVCGSLKEQALYLDALLNMSEYD